MFQCPCFCSTFDWILWLHFFPFERLLNCDESLFLFYTNFPNDHLANFLGNFALFFTQSSDLFYKIGYIPYTFYTYFRLFNTVDQKYSSSPVTMKKFAHDMIRTADLWCRKQPLYQLSHNSIFVYPYDKLLSKYELGQLDHHHGQCDQMLE